MEDPFRELRQAAINLKTQVVVGPVASWEVYDLSQLPGHRAAIDSRVLKYTSLTKNLSNMMLSVWTLYRDPRYEQFFVPELESLASRLTWIMLYFYGAMTHYSSWIFGQTQVNSIAQRGDPDWTTFVRSLGQFFTVLAKLPTHWLSAGLDVVINNTGQQQIIPTDAPLELVVRIYLFIHDMANDLRDPGKTMASWSLSKLKEVPRSELT